MTLLDDPKLLNYRAAMCCLVILPFATLFSKQSLQKFPISTPEAVLTIKPPESFHFTV